jgi:hypothetical protein
VLAALALMLAVLVVGTPRGARAAVERPTFADAAFERVWERYDRPVLVGSAFRSWTWAGGVTGAMQEPFREGPGGRHLVQYFDKSRMEINDPGGDKSSPFFVTQGLLASDMIIGRVQVGVNTFEPRRPAAIPFGDADDTVGPTYASFSRLLGAPARARGEAITASLDRAGTVGTVADSRGVVSVGDVPGSGHSIASPFWDYLRAAGPVYDGGNEVTEPLYNPTFYVTGLPITEAYWTRLKAAGATKTVLIQCFERRCLTYTPDNAPEWRVEQGNTGLQYYRWRYETPAEPTPGVTPTRPGPTASPSAATPVYRPSNNRIAVQAARDGGSPKVILMEPDGSNQLRLTGGEGEELDPAWSPDRTKLAFTHQGYLYTIGVDGTGLQRLDPAGRFQSSGDRQPVWSPDGRQLAFTRCRDGVCNSDVWIVNADGTGGRFVAGAASEPSWSPDGKRLLFASSIGVDLAKRTLSTINVDGTGLTPLTAAGPGRMPTWSPDGTAIAFVSQRDGKAAVYTAKADGSGVKRLTNAAADDYAPTWSPDGKRIAFASTRDRSAAAPNAVAIYIMNADGSNQTRITDAAGSNAMPAWAR